MFDIGASELLLIVIVAIVVIGPKDLPLAMRTAGRWIGKMRRVSNHFRAGIETMIREAEMEEMEQKWREQNEAIMKQHPVLPGDRGEAAEPSPHPVSVDAASAEAAIRRAVPVPETTAGADADSSTDERAEPQLPLTPP